MGDDRDEQVGEGLMFERFTRRARQVVVLAQEESRGHGGDRIDSIAVLLGLLRESDGIAARVLGELGIEADTVRGEWGQWPVEPLAPNIKPQVGAGQIPFTVAAKQSLELALREALSLGHNYIGTEHILLGLIRGDGFAKATLDVDAEKVRTAIIRALSRPGGTDVKVAEPSSEQLDEVGRATYAVFVSALSEETRSAWGGAVARPVVWEFLSERERRAWTAVGVRG
jgi:ATP-dependent Clp protease ATP-binding subunit ClpC